MPAVSIKNLGFSYTSSAPVLDIKSIEIGDGELVFLYGPSGCGKTTLLSLIAGVTQAQTGSLSVLNEDFSTIKSAERDRLRGKSIGYIFQVFNLVPYLSVLQNILLPTLFGRLTSAGFSNAEDEAKSLALALGIHTLLDKPVQNLSIGQQQRVAAARAFLGSPGLILADEPTSALDADARSGFLDLLFDQARREKSAVLFVSHDRSLASRFDRQISLPDLNASIGGRV